MASLLLVDNGSVFTKNLTDFLSSKNITFKVVTYEGVSEIDLRGFDAMILSGRRKNNRQMNAVNSRLINHTISENKALLGICYGAEMLALTTGGTIRKMESAHKGEAKVTTVAENPLCSGTIRVYQSHNYEISRLGKSLENLGSSDRCKHELIRLRGSRIFGTQFHPEMSDDGLDIIERFLSL